MEMCEDRILLIDEAGFSCVCSAILETEGFMVESISHEKTYPVQLNLQDFALVITSYPLGTSVVEDINNLTSPIIVLTDHISRELIRVLEGFGESYCMIKPLDYQKFKSLVKQLMAGDLSGRGGYSIV
jgi:DNA-binding NtrC family response regulator